MDDILYSIANFALSILTSLWFWIVLLVIVLWRILTLVYVKLKLKALQTLDYSRSVSSDGIFVGEVLELTETICNPTWIPLFLVYVDFYMPSGLTIDDVPCERYTKFTSVFNIPPFSKVQKTHTVRADRRDHYHIYTTTIEYKKNEFLFTVPLDFYAYPNCRDSGAGLSIDIYHAGNAVSDRKYLEDPFFISGIRPYSPGDSMRYINFKASVRSFSGGMRELMCNSYDSSRNYDSMIFLDLTHYPDATIDSAEQMEVGLRYACYLFREVLKHDGRVGFSANCSVSSSKYIYVPCGCGNMHAKTILENFAEITRYARRDYSMTALLKRFAPELSADTDIYLITASVDQSTSQLLRALERSGRNVRVIPLAGGKE